MKFNWAALSAVAIMSVNVLCANYGYDNSYYSGQYYDNGYYPNSYVEGYQQGQYQYPNQQQNYGGNQQQGGAYTYPYNYSGYTTEEYQTRQFQDQQQGFSGNQGSNSFNVSDRELLNKIQGILSNSVFQNVVVRVKQGNVILEGTVDSDQVRQDLKDKISSINGIKSINDRIETRIGFQKPQDKLAINNNDYSANDENINQNQAANQDPDLQIKQRVMDALKKGFFSKRFLNVQVDVQNKVVTLKGTVDTEADVRRAEEQAKKVDGVKEIANQLKVQYTRSGS